MKTSSGSFGAVQYHTEEEYGLVCADGFDANAANVVCKQKNYIIGLPVCCSGFGPFKNMEFSMSDVKCSGDESSLRDCSYTDVDPVCPSGHYAGVVCTHFNPGFISKIMISFSILFQFYFYAISFQNSFRTTVFMLVFLHSTVSIYFILFMSNSLFLLVKQHRDYQILY